MNLKKNIPNIISILRIPLSLTLLLTITLSIEYLFIYTLCAITDVLDGYIARKTDNVSNTGSKLDSIADLVFILTFLITIIPILITKVSDYLWIWILIIAVIKITSIIISYKKYSKIVFLHTYLNKSTGILLYIFPFLINRIEINFSIMLICIIATIAATEELLIQIYSKKIDTNIKYIFNLLIKL